jgi:N-methylhydantoinase B
MTVDFTGTSPQVRGAINSVYSFTASAAWACVRSILDNGIPNNAGFFRPVEVIAPPGTIVNPRSPAPVAARGLTGFRIADTVFGALAKLAPHLVPACGASSPDAGVSFGGYDREGRPFVYLEFLVGSWGGGPDRDGMDACTGMIINYSNTPAELLETEQPLRVERYAFVPDTGGAGRYRGGLALERHLRFLSDQAIVQVRSDRRDVPPYGLEGGAPGASSDVVLERAGGEVEACPAKFMADVRRGDLLKVRLAGGGGYGDPRTRDPAAVAADVLAGKVSAVRADADYAVAFTGDPPQLDEARTAALRGAAP